jgi:hypothetical protein
MLATACGNGNGAGRLAVSARTVGPAAAAAPAASGLDLGDGIVITRVRLAVQRISLETSSSADTSATAAKESGSGGSGGCDDGSGGSGGSGADDGPGEEDEVRVGPFAVDLGADALAGGIHAVFDGDVPAGTYRELRVAVGPVADAAAGSAVAALDGHSVVLDGTIDGAPFTFVSSLSSAQKIEMTVQVAADGSTSGVTLTIDPSGWFVAADGTRLDPAMESSRAAIEDHLRASIGVELEQEGGRGGADDGAGHT